MMVWIKFVLNFGNVNKFFVINLFMECLISIIDVGGLFVFLYN